MMTEAQYRFFNWYFSSGSNFLDNEIKFVNKMLTEFISESIQEYKKNENNCGRLEDIYYKLRIFQVNCNNTIIASALNELVDIVRSNTEFFHNVLVHGSYSTNDYSVGWSDLDALMIIKDDVFLDPVKLYQVRSVIIDCIKLLKKIDPLSHHEFQIISESDLLKLPSHWLPKSVIGDSNAILSGEIKIAYSDVSDTALSVIENFTNTLKMACSTGYLDHHPWYGEYLLDNYKNNNNGMYQLKYLLSVLVLMPAIYYASIGKSTTKPKAIEMLKIELDRVDWEIIDKATTIRAKWPLKETHPYRSNIIPGWVIEDLGVEYFDRSYKLVSQILQYAKNYSYT